MRWIEVEEDLPEASIEVLVMGTTNNGRRCIASATFDPKYGWRTDCHYQLDVHYWIEMPNMSMLKIEEKSPSASD